MKLTTQRAQFLAVLLFVLTGFLTWRLLPIHRLSSSPPASVAEASLPSMEMGQTPPHTLGQAPVQLDAAKRAQLHQTYGHMPLSFEANQGQTDACVKFLARGNNQTLFLTANEAVLQLRATSSQALSQESSPRPSSDVLRLRLLQANPNPALSGLKESPSKSNYFIGHDPQRWRTNVTNFAEVKYEAVYPGIDLVWHGQQRQLEYDFIVAPGADARQIKLAFTGARQIHLTDDGALALPTASAELRMLKPQAWQEVNGERREVACDYHLNQWQQVQFHLGEYDPALPLVIDPVLAYSTYLGGAGADQGLGIAVDAAGSAYITGSTTSTDFPGPSPIQSAKGAGSGTDAFVLKLNPSGTALVYATYLGGGGSDTAYGIAVDTAGNAYITGETGSGDFPKTNGAFQTATNGNFNVFVTKLSPNGNALVYSTFFGGSNTGRGYGIAVDASGNAYITGQTDSTDFPVSGSSTTRSGNPILKSANQVSNWSASGQGLTASSVSEFAQSLSNTNTVYAATNYGVFKSTDGGSHWSFTGGTLTTRPQLTTSVAVDPTNAATLYAAASNGLWKSTDGGDSWTPKTNGFFSSPFTITIDPVTPATVYVGATSGVFKSINGGDSWASASLGLNSGTRVNKLAIVPSTPATIYAATTRGMFKTTNGASSWSAINNGFGQFVTPNLSTVLLDPLTPTTLYVGGASTPISGVFKSTNSGSTWTPSSTGISVISNGQSLVIAIPSIAIDPATPTTLYAASAFGVFKSTNGAATWTMSNNGLTNLNVNALAIDRNSPLALFAGTNIGLDAFVTKLNATGSALVYSRYLGGQENDLARSIAIDASGNAYVTGTTSSIDFPTATPLQATNGGGQDAFVTKISADGTMLVYSTYLGGSGSDTASAIAVNSTGHAFITGATGSPDFHVVNSLKSPPINLDLDAFVAKLNPTGSTLDYATCLGGDGIDAGQGIAIDTTSNIYITGFTGSANFPLVSAFQSAPNTAGDAFVMKLSADGLKLLYSSPLGGSGSDQGNGIALDSAGNLYLVGTTSSTDFPTVNPLQTARGSSDAFIARLGPAADLAVTMTASPNPVTLGNNLTYTMIVTNNGELPATGVTLTDTLPAGATFVSASASQGSCAGTSAMTCNLGNLANGGSATVTLAVKPPGVSPLSNSASVTGNEPDSNTSNNTATASVNVDFVDLSVTITTPTDQVAPGAKVTYFITVTNNAGVTATSVILTDNLPANLTYLSCGSVTGTCGGSSNNRTISFGTLANGETKAVALTAQVSNSADNGAIIVNTVTAASPELDANPGNNTSAATITVTATPLQAKTNGKIVYVDVTKIMLVNADGTNLATLYEASDSYFYFPTWSPDGTRIAFQKNTPSTSGNNLFVMNADGTGIKQVASNLLLNSRATWSPKGDKLAFVSAAGQQSGINLVNADGTGQTLIYKDPGVITDLDWSPDGAKFAYVKSGDIWTMNLDGSEQTRLTTDPSNEFGPRWSPDGTRLLFTRIDPNNEFVYRMNADGTNQQRLINESNNTQWPAWSPDRNKIAYQGRGLVGTSSLVPQVFVINTDGTGSQRLSDPQSLGTWPDWQPIPTGQPLIPTPPTPTYSISGQLLLSNGMAVFGLINVTGTRSFQATTAYDVNGQVPNFLLGNLPEGGNFTITPDGQGRYSLSPTSVTITNLRQNQVVNFTATPILYTISGRVTDSSGNPLSGVVVALSHFGTFTIKTDANGNYSFPNLPPGDNYAVRADGDRIYDFSPAPSSFTLNSDKTINFTGTRLHYPINGQAFDLSGNPVSGVTITLSGASSGTATTDNSGKYSFDNLTSGLPYAMTPRKSGYVFAPGNTEITSFRGDSPFNFTAVPYQVATVSAASFSSSAMASEAIVSAFGTGLATGFEGATYLPLPTILAGTTVKVRDAFGLERLAPLFYVSPGQINYLIPTDTTTGFATIFITNSQGQTATGVIQVTAVAPGFFTANTDGQGAPAAIVVHATPDGAQTFDLAAVFDPAQGKNIPRQIDLGPAGDVVVIELFGTGLRYRSALANVIATIGGVPATVYYAGAQGNFSGLDQVNVEVPRSLIGRGEVDLVLTVDGKPANTVQVNIK